MSSLFLGNIFENNKKIEIHACTKDLPFREFKKTEIADKELYNKMLNGRFRLIKNGKPFFCTAINPKINEETEENPHDSRDGTIHFVAINTDKEILSSLSVAVDIEQNDRNSSIGLPLENKWKQNGYAQGNDLDKFRKNYLYKNFGINHSIKPYEMGELYRHYKLSGIEDTISRLSVYTGAYHLLVREARNKGLTQTHIWVYDAVIKYFNLYRFIGAGVLRNALIKSNPEWLSPEKRFLTKKNEKNRDSFFFKNTKISRNIEVPFPINKNGQLSFERKLVPFIDGLIDIHILEEMIKKDPITLSKSRIHGLSIKDREKLRFGLGIVGRRAFEESEKSQLIDGNPPIKSIFRRNLKHEYDYNDIGI